MAVVTFPKSGINTKLRNLDSSCPHLSRTSTSLRVAKTWMAGPKPGHDADWFVHYEGWYNRLPSNSTL
jgi:hypothetical protein